MNDTFFNTIHKTCTYVYDGLYTEALTTIDLQESDDDIECVINAFTSLILLFENNRDVAIKVIDAILSKAHTTYNDLFYNYYAEIIKYGSTKSRRVMKIKSSFITQNEDVRRVDELVLKVLVDTSTFLQTYKVRYYDSARTSLHDAWFINELEIYFKDRSYEQIIYRLCFSTLLFLYAERKIGKDNIGQYRCEDKTEEQERRKQALVRREQRRSISKDTLLLALKERLRKLRSI